MAKIGIDNLLAGINREQAAPKNLSEAASRPQRSIQKLDTAQTDSVVRKGPKRLSEAEADELSSDLAALFGKEAGSLEAQGNGLTEDRVRALLLDD